jgi:hypothetical protein
MLQFTRANLRFHSFEAVERLCQVGFIRLVEKDSAQRIGRGYALQSSAAAEGHDRLAAGQGLHRSHPEILLARHDERARTGQQIA